MWNKRPVLWFQSNLSEVISGPGAGDAVPLRAARIRIEMLTMGDAGGKELAAEKAMRPAARARSRIRPNLADKQAGSPVASALRTAYEETVKESVPAEFLDLLGKLS